MLQHRDVGGLCLGAVRAHAAVQSLVPGGQTCCSERRAQGWQRSRIFDVSCRLARKCDSTVDDMCDSMVLLTMLLVFTVVRHAHQP